SLNNVFVNQLYDSPAVCIVPFGAYNPGTTCAQFTVLISSSKIGFSAAVVIHAEVPTEQYVLPGSIEPAPTLAVTPSPPPITTGVPSKRPVCSDSFNVTLPALKVDGLSSCNLFLSILAISINLSDHCKLLISKHPKPFPSE